MLLTENLLCQNVIYYCEAGSDGKFVIHQGDRDGAILATCTPCRELNVGTDICFLDPNMTVCIDHEHYEFPVLHTVTRFTVKLSRRGIQPCDFKPMFKEKPSRRYSSAAAEFEDMTSGKKFRQQFVQVEMNNGQAP